MLCNICLQGLQGIWDPTKTKRVCRLDEFQGREEDLPSDTPGLIRVETYKTVEPHDPENYRPEHYIFGHHVTKESYEQSVRDGCVMCDAVSAKFGREPKPDPKITALGYYSLFSIGFQDRPIMFVYVNDSRGGFELSPHLGKCNLII